MTKKFLYSVFALALLSSTIGCPPPAPQADVNIDTDTTMEPMAQPSGNMTATTETPSGNMTATTETPSGNMTSVTEVPTE